MHTTVNPTNQPIGSTHKKKTQVVEYSRRYDMNNTAGQGCEIAKSNEGVQCSVEIVVEE